MICKVALSIGILLAGVQAQQAVNCVYQSLKCGSALLAAPFSKSEFSKHPNFTNIHHLLGYTEAQLAAAVNDTASIPPLTAAQLSQTLFHCADILGTITGNAYCFAGCDSKPGIRNDQCVL